MTPTARTLLVLEYLMEAGPGPVKQVDIAKACDLSPATLNRIIQELSEWGYLFRTSERYCVRNFRMTRNVPASEAYLAELDRTVTALTAETGAAAEVVIVAGHELLWHRMSKHPNPEVTIRAQVGFRRSLYELDVLSRLYLSRLSIKELKSRFYTQGFYFTGHRTDWISEPAAMALIETEREHLFSIDDKPNHVGIRRFATVITSPEGEFLHLLSLADQASDEEDLPAKVEKFGEALILARERLNALVKREDIASRPPAMHHLLPQIGG